MQLKKRQLDESDDEDESTYDATLPSNMDC